MDPSVRRRTPRVTNARASKAWTIHFVHFAQMDASLSSIVDLGHAAESPVKSTCSNTKSPLQIAEDEIRQRGFEVVRYLVANRCSQTMTRMMIILKVGEGA